MRLSILVIALCLASCVSGSVVITGEKRPPTDPSAITIYLSMPDNTEVIGVLRASSDAGLTEQKDHDNAFSELKKQAALVGANGLVLDDTADKNTLYWLSGEIILTGKAIWVESKPNKPPQEGQLPSSAVP